MHDVVRWQEIEWLAEGVPRIVGEGLKSGHDFVEGVGVADEILSLVARHRDEWRS
jgi:hypothetical protein